MKALLLIAVSAGLATACGKADEVSRVFQGSGGTGKSAAENPPPAEPAVSDFPFHMLVGYRSDTGTLKAVAIPAHSPAPEFEYSLTLDGVLMNRDNALRWPTLEVKQVVDGTSTQTFVYSRADDTYAFQAQIKSLEIDRLGDASVSKGLDVSWVGSELMEGEVLGFYFREGPAFESRVVKEVHLRVGYGEGQLPPGSTSTILAAGPKLWQLDFGATYHLTLVRKMPRTVDVGSAEFWSKVRATTLVP